jgi:hypothetical protein
MFKSCDVVLGKQQHLIIDDEFQFVHCLISISDDGWSNECFNYIKQLPIPVLRPVKVSPSTS